MSAIRQSVKVFNRRGIFHVTRTRTFCSGGMKTDEVQEKDLFITKVYILMISCKLVHPMQNIMT